MMKMKQNAFTGNNTDFYKQLKKSIKDADSIDIIVSFLMKSGVKLIIDDLRDAVDNNKKIRILTSRYLNITQPEALILLKELKDIDLRFYSNKNKSFHPKAYIFHNKDYDEIYVGSSNLSKGALTDSIEWNYHFTKSQNEDDFNHFQETFNDLFEKHSIEITDKILNEYSKKWKRPKLQLNQRDNELFEPNGAQLEALYNLNKSREEGYDKALVVAATGIGKTYLAAFDAKNYEKILFLAHREEIITQASESFKNIYPNKTQGFYYSKDKDIEKDIIFALVQSLGKKTNLNEFKRDYFDYIIIDEFHHAVADNYKRVLDYFTPKFLLGLTATPERLDNRDVFALCDYNNVYEIRLKEAINKGYLSPFRYYGIYDDTVDYSQINMKNGRYDEKDLEEKLMIHKRAELVLRHFLKYNSSSAIGFCSSRNHAEYMAKYFTENDIPSAAVYSGSQGEYTENRKDAVEKLKNNKLKALFTVDMFNEGVDIPSIDTVLFLRPTQSPTIFLQQLGRGLRKDENKKYLTVLDFIGNYKKANMAPFLLSGYDYNTKTLLNESVMEFEYPDDCYIDFDFKLVDLFKIQATQELKIKDRIVLEYESIKAKIGKRPSRVDLFLGMDDSIITSMKKSSKINLFRDYLKFLDDNDELNIEEREFISTPAHDFLKTIETTNMTKSYKMPILKAFYNDGEIKLDITEDDVYKSMREFYSYKSNAVDMLKDKSSKNFASWQKKQYLSLAKRNPIKFLLKTHSEFFIKKEGYAISLSDELKDYINLDSFKNHFKDIIEYRTLYYYKTRYEKKSDNYE
ncbi:DEAD/DEAH box helicase domain-containing protein [Methanobrevibacter millerae]|uniref:DEAD/DEAH box helicase domain-containing protein n=2 Tax=Methanobrevibacter millerae TaxID=230361 RepID=A0A0U2V3H5_9EURY|nr:DEAD/DEAH box helicase domain-containing protein [Methanobrevibacter millerae]